jgi:hypothetical protein
MNTTRVMYQCNIDPEVSEKFVLALMLNKEDADSVVEKMMSQYISESFSRVSKAFSSTEEKQIISSYDSNEDFGKANRRIPSWARKPQQNNHRIIKAFLELFEEFGSVTVEELSERCSNADEYPELFVSDFKGNFAQMKTDAGKSHGKVFITNGDDVEIWDDVKDVLIANKNSFLGNDEGSANRNKITKLQIETVYDYAKKAYHGEISGPKAADKVAEQSGMNRNSAQRSIYVFMNMMNSQVYKSIIGEEQTRYYFENILNDFGKESLASAIKATEKHIQYREDKFHTNVFGIRQIVEEFKKKI